ncbi:Uncharacterised protein [Salmonella enterica subsp. enterica serovar Braenderup]|nr:Uncharacterised protein [Salmonella enterica subsp. enterica serovar Braenderup]
MTLCGHPVNHIPVMGPFFRVPLLHHHPFTVHVAQVTVPAVQPDRRQRGHHGVLLPEYPLRLQLTAYHPRQYGLLTHAADLRHALFPGFHRGHKIPGQPGIADIPVRLADNGRRGLLPALPAVTVHAGLLHGHQRAAGTGALTAVGNEHLDVMTRRAIQQGQSLLQGQLFPLVDNNGTARGE